MGYTEIISIHSSKLVEIGAIYPASGSVRIRGDGHSGVAQSRQWHHLSSVSSVTMSPQCSTCQYFPQALWFGLPVKESDERRMLMMEDRDTSKHRQPGVTKHNEPVWTCFNPAEGTFSFVPPFEWDIKRVCVRVNVCLSATKSIIGTKQAEKSIHSQRPLNCLHDTPTQSSLSSEQLCC